MKKTLISIGSALLFAGAAHAGDVSYVLETPGVMCSSSSASAQAAVQAVEGVQSVAAEKNAHTVTVAFDDSTIALGDIVEALNEAGYAVESHSRAQ